MLEVQSEKVNYSNVNQPQCCPVDRTDGLPENTVAVSLTGAWVWPGALQCPCAGWWDFGTGEGPAEGGLLLLHIPRWGDENKSN